VLLSPQMWLLVLGIYSIPDCSVEDDPELALLSSELLFRFHNGPGCLHDAQRVQVLDRRRASRTLEVVGDEVIDFVSLDIDEWATRVDFQRFYMHSAVAFQGSGS